MRPGTTHSDSKVTDTKLAAGLANTMPDLAVDMILKVGIRLVDPNQAEDLYETMHSYLAHTDITGVKVDVIHVMIFGSKIQMETHWIDHLCAYHAASRAICGGPVYVSDKVGHHNLDLLRKLVLVNGIILCASIMSSPLETASSRTLSLMAKLSSKCGT
ncbi:hypothetical protein Ancab_012980 [Ancistrocladus abbreviatus]